MWPAGSYKLSPKVERGSTVTTNERGKEGLMRIR